MDFGALFRAIRDTLNWSQEILGLVQDRIFRIETGKRQLLDLRVVVTAANNLAIPAGKLGLHGRPALDQPIRVTLTTTMRRCSSRMR
ncbi:MAG: hypothetical protein WCF33_08615 [Pseudonocardiaceae bacterium]